MREVFSTARWLHSSVKLKEILSAVTYLDPLSANIKEKNAEV